MSKEQLLTPEQLWNKTFQHRNYAFDLDENLILKSHYNQDTIYSWGVDFFNTSDSDQQYLASTKFISTRASRNEFINDKQIKYIVNEDEDGTFAWVSPNKIIDHNNVYNIDLVMQKNLQEVVVQDNFLVVLDIKKMHNRVRSSLVNFIRQYLDASNLLFIDVDSESRSDTVSLKFQYATPKVEEQVELFNRLINLVSLLPLFIFRSRKQFNDVWIDPYFVKPGLYFNLYAIVTRSNDDIAFLNAIDSSSYSTVYNNTLFISENLKLLMERNGYLAQHFRLAKEILAPNFHRVTSVKRLFRSYTENAK